MSPFRTAVAAAALGLGLLTACDDDGGSTKGTGDYCADLEAVQKELSSVSGGDGDLGDIEDTLASLGTLKDEAPEEIAEDWATLYAAFDEIVDTYKEAGLTAEDMAAIQNGQVPDGIDQDTLLEVSSAIAEIGQDADLQGAVEAIREHAKDECGLSLQ